MQFQISAIYLIFIACMTMFVSASPIPITSSAGSDVVARLPELVESPMAPTAEARMLEVIGDSPLAPLDSEARSLSVPRVESSDGAAEARTPEQENPEARECGRWACI